jgi:hypothetical protein
MPKHCSEDIPSPKPFLFHATFADSGRTETSLEVGHLAIRDCNADRGGLHFSGSGLGRADQSDHGHHSLCDGSVVHACARGAEVEEVAFDGAADVVMCGWLLLDLLEMEKSSGPRMDARSQRPSLAFLVLDVRFGLVLPWYGEGVLGGREMPVQCER